MALQCDLREVFAAQANPERALGQQRYMKSALPFYGLTKPDTARAVRTVLARHPLAEREDWVDAILTIWDEAERREELYAVLALLRHRAYRAWALDPAHLETLRRLIITGAWWDLVDEIAAHCVGDLLAARPAAVTPVLYDWAREENLWVRRSAILSQLTAKADTDRNLLSYAIEHSLADPDFFARKAIGWALREHAKTDPAWVIGFVSLNADRLSPLSRREALKHFG
ncbi:MAG: DNA alkylation repair protein [Micropruina sp.]|nr:DNA alkylation repair protein [Micropruina sp.]